MASRNEIRKRNARKNPLGKLSFILLLCFTVPSARAQDDSVHVAVVPSVASADTTIAALHAPRGFVRFANKVVSSPAFRIIGFGSPLILNGLLVKGSDRHFRQMRNTFMPRFNSKYDNYLQFLPAAVMVGMKSAGVESRSSWGRMLTSDAFSALTMFATVQTLKRTTKIERPDGSNNHSFPSGHTATAFMTAAMFSREYGGRSPWYSVGGYTVATATGLMRMANNKHWMSDVLVGAGIGVISTELGYYLADLIFKDKGIHKRMETFNYDSNYRPSFLGIRFGFSAIPGDYYLGDGSEVDFSSGCTAGLEGAWFFNPHWGIGGEFSATDVAVIHDHKALDTALDMLSMGAGPYVSLPIIPRLLFGGKLLANYTHYASFNEDGIHFTEWGRWGLKTGFSLTFRASPNMGIKVFGDYTMSRLPLHTDKRFLHQFFAGSSIAVTF